MFVAIAAVQWRAGGTEIRLDADTVVIRGVRPQRAIPLDDIVRVSTEQRLAHQVVLETSDRRIALPRAVTSEGFLGPDDRSEEIRAAIAAALELNR